MATNKSSRKEAGLVHCPVSGNSPATGTCDALLITEDSSKSDGLAENSAARGEVAGTQPSLAQEGEQSVPRASPAGEPRGSPPRKADLPLQFATEPVGRHFADRAPGHEASGPVEQQARTAAEGSGVGDDRVSLFTQGMASLRGLGLTGKRAVA